MWNIVADTGLGALPTRTADYAGKHPISCTLPIASRWMTDQTFPSTTYWLKFYCNEPVVLEVTLVTWCLYDDELRWWATGGAPFNLPWSTRYFGAPRSPSYALKLLRCTIQIVLCINLAETTLSRLRCASTISGGKETSTAATNVLALCWWVGIWASSCCLQANWATSEGQVPHVVLSSWKGTYIHSQCPACSLPTERTLRAWVGKFGSN